MPLFNRFIEIGRVLDVKKGALQGKRVVVLDVIDGRRALVSAPGVERQAVNFNDIAITGIKLDINRGTRPGLVDKAWKAADVDGKYEATQAGKRNAVRAKRAAATDFDRFKIMLAKKKRSAAVRTAVRKATSK